MNSAVGCCVSSFTIRSVAFGSRRPWRLSAAKCSELVGCLSVSVFALRLLDFVLTQRQRLRTRWQIIQVDSVLAARLVFDRTNQVPNAVRTVPERLWCVDPEYDSPFAGRTLFRQ